MNICVLQASEVPEQWESLAPLLRETLSHVVQGEFTLEDVYDMACRQQAFLLVVREAHVPELVCVFEWKHYPRRQAVNWMAIGGHGLHRKAARYFPLIKAWLHDQGVDFMEAYCQPGMVRMLNKLGFQTVYQYIRLNLGGGEQS